MDEIINSPLLWALCSVTVAVVAFQAVAYFRLTKRQAARVDVSEAQCRQAMRIGMMTAVGPALGILIVMVGLMAVLGNPLTWMRLSIIVSATNELAAAKIGAEAAGVTFGGADYTKEALMVSWFGMWLNGVGSLLAVVLFAKHLAGIQRKVVSRNPRILAIVSGAAMCAIYGNLSSGTLLGGGDFVAAWAAAGIATFGFYQIAQRVEKLKEYSLGLAMIVGTLAGAAWHGLA
ncbi:DUF5058 family protein [Rubrivivax gelatinosus]|uniref:Uncharacterized protein DUF5058 n=1 Tax=Rubrivivax gelatinosus TaxID=28068 RepID=A0A4R2MAP6_RUBGE|nr:DUF5058 family protein [Rubrivivax gelatinosus]MBK1688324.1 DUF5058 domain-containing protein [Rubrivivax gelatinosus]TCP03311.1 uncharacterized protein DUF5058 [Rubrivivax gelatinosus]